MLTNLPGQCTSPPALAISDDMKSQPSLDCVCLPTGQLQILYGNLHRLIAVNSQPTHQPIEHFFHLPACDQRENALRTVSGVRRQRLHERAGAVQSGAPHRCATRNPGEPGGHNPRSPQALQATRATCPAGRRCTATAVPDGTGLEC